MAEATDGNMAMVMSSVTSIVAMYISLLIIKEVADVAQIDVTNDTVFGPVYTGLGSTVSTVFTMLGLALFVMPAAYILRLLNYAF
ncbi:MAG: hypothetical protein Q4P17_03965 [Methanobacterium sp.]|nr:hypothetical protein [Methanobacterium sp.]